MRETGNKTTCRQWLGCFCCGMVLFVGMGAIKARADSEGRVVTYPAPAGEAATEDYRLEVDGNPVDVYRAETEFFDKKYYFASFDFSGEVTVRVTSPQSLEGASILPERFGIRPTLEKPNALTFTASKPFRIAIERTGGTTRCCSCQSAGDRSAETGRSNVVYFGPGIHSH